MINNTHTICYVDLGFICVLFSLFMQTGIILGLSIFQRYSQHFNSYKENLNSHQVRIRCALHWSSSQIQQWLTLVVKPPKQNCLIIYHTFTFFCFHLFIPWKNWLVIFYLHKKFTVVTSRFLESLADFRSDYFVLNIHLLYIAFHQ